MITTIVCQRKNRSLSSFSSAGDRLKATTSLRKREDHYPCSSAHEHELTSTASTLPSFKLRSEDEQSGGSIHLRIPYQSMRQSPPLPKFAPLDHPTFPGKDHHKDSYS